MPLADYRWHWILGHMWWSSGWVVSTPCVCVFVLKIQSVNDTILDKDDPMQHFVLQSLDMQKLSLLLIKETFNDNNKWLGLPLKSMLSYLFLEVDITWTEWFVVILVRFSRKLFPVSYRWLWAEWSICNDSAQSTLLYLVDRQMQPYSVPVRHWWWLQFEPILVARNARNVPLYSTLVV